MRDSLTGLGATVRLLEHGISLDLSECVDCGACIALCPREVFSFDKEWKLVITEDKCILCGKCVPACPHQALSLPLLIREPFRYRETFAAILADSPAHVAAAKEGMIAARMVLETYIAETLFLPVRFSRMNRRVTTPLSAIWQQQRQMPVWGRWQRWQAP